MAANSDSLPLYKTISRRRSLRQRSFDVLILLLLLILVSHRLVHIASLGAPLPWLVACFSELCFSFFWLLNVNCKWSPVEHIPFPDRLEQRVSESELPPVDLFVTTADPVLEPPIITVNTVLSLLAVNYPANKLACYVSDDGCSALTYFSLVEAARFAKIWVPFCRKHKVQVRAPFRYFSSEPEESDGPQSIQFQEEWNLVKCEYEKLYKEIEHASRDKSRMGSTDELLVFSGTDSKIHPTIIKVIWENRDGVADGVPHLIYISREKRPKHPHHYKAGAMNVLTRVSGLMTNAPFMLNLDCDMHVNNPDVVRQAMCFFLGAQNPSDCAFVQTPQLFHDSAPGELLAWHEFMGYGIVGIQGPFCYGTGCFLRREVIYGLSPEDVENEGNLSSRSKRILTEFGSSKVFVRSASEALQDHPFTHPAEISSSMDAAYEVAGCIYEHGTGWGSKFGWLYGSVTEDVNTSLKIHSRGWKTLYNSPAQPAFLGCAPPAGPAAMIQQRRWATGLLEVLFSRNSPILGTIYGKLRFRQCLAYLWILVWGLRSIPELCYTLLPAYCIITNSYFLPKFQDPFIFIPLALFWVWNYHTLSEFSETGTSFDVWWASQTFARIKATGPWLLSTPSIVLRLLGLSDRVFEVTAKTMPSSTAEIDDAHPVSPKFTFDDSLNFVPGLAILLVHMAGLASLAFGLTWRPLGGSRAGLGEILASVWVVMSYAVFLRGLFERDRYRIPTSTILKSSLLALMFVHLSKSSAVKV